MGRAAANRVRERRQARGLSQLVLAERAGLTRQSIGAIEAGRATPAVDVAMRIARTLDCRVEDLFAPAEAPATLEVELTREPTTRRVALTHVGERWVGLPLGVGEDPIAADGLVIKAKGRLATVQPLQPLDEARNTLIVAGCAAGLGLLVDRLKLQKGAGRFIWLPSSSGAALRGVARAQAHVAGVHMPGTASTDGNVAAARRAARREPLVLITLARWEAGLVTRADDLRVRGAADLAEPRLRLVAREKGAGARALLERELVAAGLPIDIAARTPLIAAGHIELARTIAMSAGDAGVATRDAALAFGLRFVPLAEERFDLAIPRSLATDPRVERLLDALVSQAGRRELEALGYDMSSAGRRVAEVRVV